MINSRSCFQKLIHRGMSTTCTINFKNRTTQEKPVQFAVFKEYPRYFGLRSAWKRASVYNNGQAKFQWNLPYNAVISNYRDKEGIDVYTSSQSVSANLKDQFEVNDIEGIQFVTKVGSTGDDNTISIDNKSSYKANIDVGMDDKVQISEIFGGVNKVFKFTPVYYVAAYQNEKTGEEFSSVELVSPKKVSFNTGYTHATVTLMEDGDTLKLKVEQHDSEAKDSW
ncbi:hypothetical protein C1645_737480 [Glomus cerebriforme]|uniref:Uncharacterized protein n=1 Tax=Glomus cerebriforme TaxID=658196 RepID=A0A397T7D3_9GLOM|nr:hypothetical protein C1645_737480 [Glomus cerebriforme]